MHYEDMSTPWVRRCGQKIERALVATLPARAGREAEEGQAMTDETDKGRPLAEKRPPPGWAADELTEFLDRARHNQWATFFNKPAVKTLIAIDALFATVSKDWHNPGNQIGANLVLRCHAAFRASAGLAMSGQATDSYVQCRSVLESAAYAVHIHLEPELGRVWLARHQDAASHVAQRKAFMFGNVQKSVERANIHAAQRLAELYQRVIDLGGHPNERSVTANIQITKEKGRRTMLSISQHGDGPQLDHALMSVAQCGMVSLEMLQVVFGARFELLGISAEMLSLRSGL